MITSQAREINNSKELTILRLRNVNQKECWTIVFGVRTGPFDQHYFLLNSLVIFPWFEWWYMFVTALLEAGTQHKADDIEE